MKLVTPRELALAPDPVGCYSAGATFVHFCLHEGLWGIVLWGCPSEHDARELGRSLVAVSSAARHASIVDATRLESGGVRAYGALERFVGRSGAVLRAKVARLAVVRPIGLAGAMVAGVGVVLDLPPVAFFRDVRSAAHWLDEDAERIGDAIEEIYGRVSTTSPLLASLQAVLGTRPSGTSIAVAAKAVGMSERTLQRRLRELGTDFKWESGEARVRAAQQLLLEPDISLTRVALEAGFASIQHFSRVFRSHTGVRPSDWRAAALSAKPHGR